MPNDQLKLEMIVKLLKPLFGFIGVGDANGPGLISSMGPDEGWDKRTYDDGITEYYNKFWNNPSSENIGQCCKDLVKYVDMNPVIKLKNPALEFAFGSIARNIFSKVQDILKDEKSGYKSNLNSGDPFLAGCTLLDAFEKIRGISGVGAKINGDLKEALCGLQVNEATEAVCFRLLTSLSQESHKANSMIMSLGVELNNIFYKQEDTEIKKAKAISDMMSTIVKGDVSPVMLKVWSDELNRIGEKYAKTHSVNARVKIIAKGIEKAYREGKPIKIEDGDLDDVKKLISKINEEFINQKKYFIDYANKMLKIMNTNITNNLANTIDEIIEYAEIVAPRTQPNPVIEQKIVVEQVPISILKPAETHQQLAEPRQQIDELKVQENNEQKKEDIAVVQKEPEQDKVVNDAQAVVQQIEQQKESVLEQIDKSLAQAQIKQEESQGIDSKTEGNVQQEQLQVHEAQPGASQTEQKNNEAIDLPVETEIKNQENNQEINPSLEEKIDQNLKTQADDNSNNIDDKENIANNFNNTDTDNKENIETEQKEEDVQKEEVVVQKETNQQKNIVIETVRPPISIREPVHQNDTRLGVLTQTKEIPGLKDKIRATYYEILGLKDGASIIEVNKSYKELSKIFHPDRFHDARVMEIINNARDIARQTSKGENSKLYVPEKEKLSIETKYIDPQATQQKIILLGSVLEKLIAANNAQLLEINANEPLLTLKEMKPAENAQSQESEQAKAVENVQIVQQADQNFLQKQQEAGNTQADEKELEYTQKDNETEEIAQVKTSDIISEMTEIQQNDHEGYKTLEIQQQLAESHQSMQVQENNEQQQEDIVVDKEDPKQSKSVDVVQIVQQIESLNTNQTNQVKKEAVQNNKLFVNDETDTDFYDDTKQQRIYKITLEEKYKQLMEVVKSYVAMRAKEGPLGLQWLFKIIYKNIGSKIVNNWKKSVVADNRKIEENIEQKIINKIGPRSSG